MRELFDEVAGKSPLDPQEAVRRATRTPQRKRFYTNAGVAEADGGFAITLDGKPIRTPSGRQVVAPTREIADAIAAEWNAQGETIDPLTMPLTRFANSVVEGVVDRVDVVADDVAKYLGSDLLFYRAGHPEALVAREGAHWDPILFWAADELGAHFILAEGIVHVAQPEAAIKAARAAFPADPWSVAALHVVTTLTGSALLALALPTACATRSRSGLPPMSMRTGTSRNGASTRRSPPAGLPVWSISRPRRRILKALQS